MASLREASFEEDDQSDSISITSTAGSEPRDVYPLEGILAEKIDEEDGQPRYLIKWEGYPVHRSTWEPAESFDDDSILFSWKEFKMKITRGLAEGFNVKAFNEEQEKIAQAKEERRVRRRAKRLKLGLPVEPELLDISDEEDVSSKINKVDKAKKARDSIPRRKKKKTQRGYALPKNLITVVEDDLDDQLTKIDRSRPRKRRETVQSDNEKRSPSADSLMEELSVSKSTRKPQGPEKPAKAPVKSQPSIKTVPTDTTKPKPVQAATRRSDSIPKVQAKPANRTGQEVIRASVSGSSYNGAVGTSRQRKADMPAAKVGKKEDLGAAIFSNWNKVQKPRQRPHVSLETANTLGEKGFRNISEQRRFELYGRNEPAPNPENLQFISLSGQGPSPKSPLAAESDVQNHKDIGIADRINEPPGKSHLSKSVPWVRAVGFADERRNRIDTETSRSPERGEDSAPTTAPSTNQASVPAAPKDPEKAMQTSVFPPGTKSTETCLNWARGDCRLPAANCGYQHERTGVVSHLRIPKYSTPPITCYYWYQAHRKQPPNPIGCKKPADICGYAHWDTGVLAKPPGGGGSVPTPISEPQSNEPISSATTDVPKGAEVSQQNHVGRPEAIIPINGPPPPKGLSAALTCYYWATRGWCTKKDEECLFAHYHTGQIAKRSNPNGIAKQTVERSQQVLSNIILESPLSPVSESSSLESSAQLPLNLNSPPGRTLFTFSAQHQANKVPSERTSSEPLNDVSVILRAKAKDNELPVDIQTRFAGFDLPSRSKFVDAAGPTPVFDIQHLCLAEDFRVKFTEENLEIYAFGYVLPGAQSSGNIIDAFSESLKLHGGAGVTFHQNFSLLVYPVHQDAWKFLDTGSQPPPADTRLRFHILAPLQSPLETFAVAAPVEDRSSYLVKLFRNILATDIETISCREGNEVIEKVAFIIWPPSHEDELDFIAEFLQAHDIKVYLSTIKGSWNHFLNKFATGTILIHPSVYHYWQIPRFTSVLKKGFNIFQLGVDLHSPGYNCIRLFPHGRVVYITDDAFANFQADALAVLKRFVNQASKRPRGFWKIAGRPGLKTWLLELAEKDFHVRKKDTTRIELYAIIDKLVPPELTDTWHPEDPSENAPVVSASVKEFPDYAKMWEENPKKASNYMVNWFAGWACTKATQFKRFVVVHPWPDDDWSLAYKHIEFVTPAEYGNLTQGI